MTVSEDGMPSYSLEQYSVLSPTPLSPGWKIIQKMKTLKRAASKRIEIRKQNKIEPIASFEPLPNEQPTPKLKEAKTIVDEFIEAHLEDKELLFQNRRRNSSSILKEPSTVSPPSPTRLKRPMSSIGLRKTHVEANTSRRLSAASMIHAQVVPKEKEIKESAFYRRLEYEQKKREEKRQIESEKIIIVSDVSRFLGDTDFPMSKEKSKRRLSLRLHR